MLILLFNIFIVYNFILIHHELKYMEQGPEEKVSGLAVQGEVSLCVHNGTTTINLFHPAGSEILNLTVNISANLSNPLGITNYTLNFSYLNSSTTSEIGGDIYDGDYNFNISWDTTLVADGNCNYRVKVIGASNETICHVFHDKTSGFFTIDNVFVEPIWNNFNNSVTTNFSLFTRFSNLSDVIIGNINGQINFSGTGWNFDSVNIDNEVKIGNNSINFTLTSDCFVTFSLKLYLFNFNLTNPIILRNGEGCPSTTCSNIYLSDNTLRFTVNSFGNYSATGNQSSNLEIWDDTDSKRGNLTKLANQNVMFFANYTNNETNESVYGTNIFCEIKFNISQYTSPVNMNLNTSSNLYEYVRNFSSRGNYSWNVFCNGTTKGFITQNVTDKVIITNTPPTLTSNISNLEWNEDTILTGLDLNDYFTDVDSDALTFTHTPVSNILIVIDSDGIVSFMPDMNFFGLRRVVFTANDPINSTDSNNVTLVINDVAEGAAPPPAAAAGGGGGGGYACVEEWYCTPWGHCINGTRTRTCYDLNNCGTFKNKPNETEPCEYVSTCYDGICNNNEDCTRGITDIPDCGGPCPPCFTCYDRQKNQDETDIDCGGKTCRACIDGKKCLQNSDCESSYCNPDKICSIPTCSDGWQNQGEEGIDCGGPCPTKCPVVEQPTIISRLFTPLVLTWIAIILLLLLLINIYGHKILRKFYVSYYSLPKFKRIISKRRADYAAKAAIGRLNKLERNLTAKNTQYILNELILAFRKFLGDLLQLNQDFSVKQLKQKLLPIKMNEMAKKHLEIFHNKLLSYQDLKLTQRDVIMLIRYAKKLVYFISKIGK